MGIKESFIAKKDNAKSFVGRHSGEMILIGISFIACTLAYNFGRRDGNLDDLAYKIYKDGRKAGSRRALGAVEDMLEEYAPDLYDELDVVVKEHGADYNIYSRN